MYRIALIERPVGTLAVFTFLHKRGEATISDFVNSGWNRRTVERSLKKLLKLAFVRRKKVSRFPRFEKRYSLTQSGIYVARFANMLREACNQQKSHSLDDLLRSPKGCMQVFVYLSRKGWRGISDLLKETGLSANQAYKCLKKLDAEGYLSIELEKTRRTRMLSCKLTAKGNRVSIILDALDMALARTVARTLNPQ